MVSPSVIIFKKKPIDYYLHTFVSCFWIPDPDAYMLIRIQRNLKTGSGYGPRQKHRICRMSNAVTPFWHLLKVCVLYSANIKKNNFLKILMRKDPFSDSLTPACHAIRIRKSGGTVRSSPLGSINPSPPLYFSFTLFLPHSLTPSSACHLSPMPLLLTQVLKLQNVTKWESGNTEKICSSFLS